jgi:peptide/nickel transport system substrate-binding protein
MRRIVWRWLVASSLLIACAAQAETRPQYGGTLRIALHVAPTSLDPADAAQTDSFAMRSITSLMFETLVTMDDSGHPQPALATSWQSASGYTRWQFQIRRGVRFHDETTFTAETAAVSLRTANPTWKTTADGDSLSIECEAPDPDLLAELALPRNAIAKRNSDQVVGTGPFHIVDWLPGKKMTLAANEDYWRGRPFLDGIEIELGKSFRDRMNALDIGHIELVEVAPEQMRQTSQEGRHVVNSAPVELLALLFTRDVQTPDEKSLREALALSIDRASIRSVLLQGAGQPAASILPNWMSGYGFVFSTGADLTRARHQREQVHATPTWTLGYDGHDPLARLLVERIALNAKDAGLSLRPTSLQPDSAPQALTADVRLMRISLDSAADAWIVLDQVAAIAGMPAPTRKNRSIEDLYATEQAMLAAQKIIPLFHLPVCYAAAPSVQNLNLRVDGTLNLTDVWLWSGKP